MPDARISEVDDGAAGIVVDDDRGVRFFAAMRPYFAFEGTQSRSAWEAERTISRFASERRRSSAHRRSY
jgi:hypothetical protein